MELLRVSGIRKQERQELVLDNISFTQEKFQQIAIAGASGAGKSTLLKIIGGLSQPDAGEVLFEGKRVKGPLETLIPGHPGVAYLSQHYELRHNYRVEEILEYANQLTEEEANTLYEVCRISHLVKRRTDQLSGGETQRIALARLLTTSPRLLLLDEPYSNLDLIHKQTLKSVIHDIGEQLGITCMLVSHDPLDTLPWADLILVMQNGRIVQEGTPEQVYHQPINEYVAGLFGKYNLVQLNGKRQFLRPEDLRIVEQGPAGSLKEHADRTEQDEQAFKGSLKKHADRTVQASTGKAHADKTSGKEQSFTKDHTTQQEQTLTGKVKRVTFLGNAYEIEVQLPQQVVTVRTAAGNVKAGDTVHLKVAAGSVWYL